MRTHGEWGVFEARREGDTYYREDAVAWYVQRARADARATCQTRLASDWNGARYVVRHVRDTMPEADAIRRHWQVIK